MGRKRRLLMVITEGTKELSRHREVLYLVSES